MNSSTSPSDKSPKLFFVFLALSSIAALLFSAWYSAKVNPEIRFYDEFLKEKMRYAQALDGLYPSKVVVSGGSSTAFAIRPAQFLKEHGVPAVNMGLQAGLGPDVIAALGVDPLRAGDTFILAVEPELLGSDNQHVWGPQFCAATKRWYAVNRFKQEPISEWTLPTYLRPGGQHYLVLLAKVAAGRPLFRYKMADVHDGGWQTTEFPADLSRAPVQNGPVQITERSRILLQSVRKYCEDRNVRVFYSMPWRFVPGWATEEERKRAAAFLVDIEKYMRILPEPDYGIKADVKLFADVVHHTNAEGAALRTEALAKALLLESRK